MCGICGIVETNSAVSREQVLKMRDTLTHRGPDDAGIFLSDDSTVGLGHRRLSIIDLSPAGHQPMPNEDSTIWVTFNGEIYNFLELRKLLEACGHTFHSRSDTEVILHLYEEKGLDFASHLDGQFAIGIWDDNLKVLVLARDRLGKKPIYYHWNGKRLLFASEAKAILEVPGVSRELDPTALDDYLTFQYVPFPATIFKEIRKLPPACRLVLSDGKLSVEPYWILTPETAAIERTEREYEELFFQLMTEAVRRRLISDVPLGVFLSGGVDSSAIVAIMSATLGLNVKTFSVGFHEQEYDELPYADLVARKFGTEHHRIVLEPSSAAELIPFIARQFDEPLADQAAVPTYLMSRAAKQHVTVCLSGEGGDELFGGYPRYGLAVERRNLIEAMALGDANLRRHLESALAPTSARYAQTLCSFNTAEKDKLLKPSLMAAIRSQRDHPYPHMDKFFAAYPDLDPLTTLQYVDIQTYLTDNLLVKVDRASMLASLEVRAPFLDCRLLEASLALPHHLKVQGGIQKYLVKRIMERHLPPQILWRPKMGFSIPLLKWFKKDFKTYARDLLLERDELFNRSYVSALVSDEWLDRPDSALKIWTLLIFKEWRRTYSA
jgi:asparagine synthase (glutamine-hydrolysing)